MAVKIPLKFITFLLLIIIISSDRYTARANNNNNDDEDSQVTIDDDNYSILHRPSSQSKLVSEAREEVTLSLDFQDMADDLMIISKFFQLAENGLVDYPILQGQVKKSQITMLQLTDKSEVAIAEFARVSHRVLDDMEATYYYLYKGHFEMATNIYTAVSNDAQKMSQKAEELKLRYKEELEKLISILEKAFTTKEDESLRKKQAKLEERNLKANLNKLQASKEEAHKKFMQMESLFYEAKRREQRALNSQNNIWKKLTNAFTSTHFGFEAFDMESYRDAAQSHRLAKQKYFDEMEKVRDYKMKVFADIAEFAQRMNNAKDEAELADIAIESLQNVIGHLEVVISILSNTAKFWNEMKLHLDNLKTSNQFESLMKIENKEEREEILRSRLFRETIVKNYARWVATYEVMRQFRTNIKPAREKLAEVVRGNLRKEEALQNIKKVGSELSAEQFRRKIPHKKNEL